jgi:hypothetical protein
MGPWLSPPHAARGSDLTAYDSMAASLDAFAWANPDWLSVVAAGGAVAGGSWGKLGEAGAKLGVKEHKRHGRTAGAVDVGTAV